MKIFTNLSAKKLFVAFVLLVCFGIFGNAYAMTPSLSVYPTSGTDSVTINVTGDANSSVILYYNSSSILQSRVLGTTSNSGYYSIVVNSSNYGITPGSLVYVVVNNQQSSSVSWPYSTYSSGTLSLSQTNLTMTVGQTSNVTAYNYYSYGNLYISSNSNPSVVTASISGNNISLYANMSGSSTVSVCQSGGSSACATIYVNVTAVYGGGCTYYTTGCGVYNPVNTLGLNISSLSIPLRGSLTISSANASGIYVSNNSNPRVVSTAYTTGTSSLVPGCTPGALYSVLTGQLCTGGITPQYYPYTVPGCVAGAMYSITTGQPCYNNYNNYNYTYPVNNNVSVTLSALAVGSSTITLCQNSTSSACSVIYVTVGY